ncbi:MAG TPA: hypothetical protein PKL14_03860 [Holophaga sp.]|nr:hypothetical protein [Holophaga sp.]
MKTIRSFARLSMVAALLAAGLACERKLSPEAQAAQDAAKASDAKVAALEQLLAEVKAGKAGASGDQATAEHLTKSEQKALERQLADAKRQAGEKHKNALDLAKAPVVKDAPKPVIVDVPAGTKLEVRLAKDLSTATVQAGDVWEGVLADPVVVDGRTVWAAGTSVRGVVSQSAPAGRLSGGQGGLGIKLTFVGRDDVDTGTYVVVGDKRGARNAKFIGGGAALGALVGILSDSKNKNDHALGGAAIGAAAGTAVAAGSADTNITLPASKPVTFSLSAPERLTFKP